MAAKKVCATTTLTEKRLCEAFWCAIPTIRWHETHLGIERDVKIPALCGGFGGDIGASLALRACIRRQLEGHVRDVFGNGFVWGDGAGK